MSFQRCSALLDGGFEERYTLTLPVGDMQPWREDINSVFLKLWLPKPCMHYNVSCQRGSALSDGGYEERQSLTHPIGYMQPW